MARTTSKLRCLLTCLSLVAFLAALGACEIAKFWKEPHMSRVSYQRAGANIGWTNRQVWSAEGGIIFRTDRALLTVVAHGDPSTRPPHWSAALYRPGSAIVGRSVPFPQNLWFDRVEFSSSRPQAGVTLETQSLVRIPWWPFILAFGVSPALRALAWARSPRYSSGCPDCGYDLRHSPHRCPECGRPTERQASADGRPCWSLGIRH